MVVAGQPKIAFYRFDESKVPDYFLQMDQTKLYTKPDIEAYPKAGQPNPIAEIFVYDISTNKTTVKLDVRDGKPFEDGVVGHYVYHVVSWSPDGKELLFNRTNRRQNILEFAAADPATGKMPGHHPRGMADRLGGELPGHDLVQGQQALHLDFGADAASATSTFMTSAASSSSTLTNHPFEVANIVKLDEKAGKPLLHGPRRRESHDDAAPPGRAWTAKTTSA